MRRKRVLFVGAFNTKNGNIGGQLYACTSLLESPLSEQVEWLLIDSTAATNLQRSVAIRIIGAAKRILKLIGFLLTRRIDTVLIFAADRGSFVEKSFMTMLAKFFLKKVILAPRSGLLLLDIKKSQHWKYLVRLSFFFADNVVCQAESWRRFFSQYIGGNPAKLVLIPNWIAADRYQLNFAFQRTRTLSPHIHVLFMGWVTKDKGIFDLLDAFREIAESRRTSLWIAGDGQDMNRAKSIVNEMGLNEQVYFYGWVSGDDKNSLLKTADIFVLPSYYEGLPNSVLEAMASGLPVVATNVGGIPDIVSHGTTGLLVSPGDINELKKALLTLIDNSSLRNVFSDAGYNRVNQVHTVTNAVERFNKIL